MARDFLGLGSKLDHILVKEEDSDGSTNLVPSSASSRMHWSFSNKVSSSSTPQILSFETAQDDRSRKAIHNPSPSFGFMTTSAAHTSNSDHKSPAAMTKNNMIMDRQPGDPYPVTTYGLQRFNSFSAQSSQGLKFSVSDQANKPIKAQNLVSVLPQGVAPIMASPVSVISASSSLFGSTELRNASKPSVGPSQLTIFYAGSVCVYDAVSPEKAQAIMLLAGNGPSASENKTNSASQVRASTSQPSRVDGTVFNSTSTASSCLIQASPISVASPVSMTNMQQDGGSRTTNGFTVGKIAVASTSSENRSESYNVATSAGSVSKSLVPGVAVPQARKASLARFLEKKKERVVNSSPYNSRRNAPDGTSKLTSDGISLSLTSASRPIIAAG